MIYPTIVSILFYSGINGLAVVEYYFPTHAVFLSVGGSFRHGDLCWMKIGPQHLQAVYSDPERNVNGCG
ncbi:hypothetical protein WA026_010965 [Henosepilachna vigintioctopunctata]|uniref:Uncharacterized protein n=1 Tax=Henosepilachna vigintioctopunctata TaxID=420089 RepID=A0AAW1URN6_9CUCU